MSGVQAVSTYRSLSTKVDLTWQDPAGDDKTRDLTVPILRNDAPARCRFVARFEQSGAIQSDALGHIDRAGRQLSC